MGETAIDEETFHEYLTEMREHYTADKVRIRRISLLARSRSTDLRSSQYHLLGERSFAASPACARTEHVRAQTLTVTRSPMTVLDS